MTVNNIIKCILGYGAKFLRMSDKNKKRVLYSDNPIVFVT